MRPALHRNPQPPSANEDEGSAEQVSSIEEFEKLAEQGKANIITARRFLVNSQREISKLPFEEQREEASKVGAGRMLGWLWRCREVSTRDEDLNKAFSNALCWHLTAERKEDFVWQWLKLHAADHHKLAKHQSWNGRLLCGLVRARMHWDRSADAAMELFVRATDMRKSVGLVHASVHIHKAMTHPRRSGDAHPLSCSPTAFDAFVAALKHVRHGAQLEAAQAHLALYHPVRPDANKFFLHYQRQLRRPELYPEIRRIEYQQQWACRMGRASYILRLQYVSFRETKYMVRIGY
jgi:hypothetical protein